MNDKPKTIPVSNHGSSPSTPPKKPKFVLKEIEPIFKTRENFGGLPDLPRTDNDFQYVRGESNPSKTSEPAVISKKAGTVLQYSTFAQAWLRREHSGFLFKGPNFQMEIIVGKGATGPYDAKDDPKYKIVLAPEEIYSFTTTRDFSVSEITDYVLMLAQSLERTPFILRSNSPLDALRKERNVVEISNVKISETLEKIDCRENLKAALDSISGILWS